MNRNEKIAALKAIAAGKGSIEDLNDGFKITMWRASDPGMMETFNCANSRKVTNAEYAAEHAATNGMKITLNL